MEAEGIEPSSQDNPDGGLYMFSRCFKSRPRTTDIDILRTGPAVFISSAANGRAREPARFFGRRFTGVNAVPTLPNYLGSDSERGAETDATRDITGIGS